MEINNMYTNLLSCSDKHQDFQERVLSASPKKFSVAYWIGQFTSRKAFLNNFWQLSVFDSSRKPWQPTLKAAQALISALFYLLYIVQGWLVSGQFFSFANFLFFFRGFSVPKLWSYTKTSNESNNIQTFLTIRVWCYIMECWKNS